MTSKLIKAEWAALPGGNLEEGPFFVKVVADTITSILTNYQGPCPEEEWLSTYLLAPGFIDIHTHGVGEQSW